MLQAGGMFSLCACFTGASRSERAWHVRVQQPSIAVQCVQLYPATAQEREGVAYLVCADNIPKRIYIDTSEFVCL